MSPAKIREGSALSLNKIHFGNAVTPAITAGATLGLFSNFEQEARNTKPHKPASNRFFKGIESVLRRVGFVIRRNVENGRDYSIFDAVGQYGRLAKFVNW